MEIRTDADPAADTVMMDLRQHLGEHPGKILRDLYLEPLGITTEQASEGSGLPVAMLERIMAGRERVGVWEADAIARLTGTSPQLWTNLQRQHDAAEMRRFTS